MEDYLKDIDGRAFYLNLVDPNLTFNNIEITLAHLFRKKMQILDNRNYSDCLYQFLQKKNYIKQDIIEVGCGLGDLALNLLKPERNVKYDINSYVMYDISPSLIETEHRRLGDLVTDYIQADCLELSKHSSNFNGMILSNAMCADLQSVYLSPEDSLEDYNIFDPDFLDFTKEWGSDKDEWYFHVGTCLFLREISKALTYGGIAVINEYAATKLNQPSLFENHYECGIDFAQISTYAKRLGFEVEIADIEEVLGISKNQQFLSVDVFTMQDRLAKMVPASVKIWKAKNPLPILAYTRDSLRETLTSDYIGLSINETNALVDALDGYFHSIHNPRFDHKNPTTWGYKCLLLRKIEPKDWEEISGKVAIPVLAEFYGETKDKASQRWKKAIYDQELGIGVLGPVLVGLFTAACYDLIKNYGPIIWRKFVYEKIQKSLNDKKVDNIKKSKILSVLHRILSKTKEN